jgi:deazaflavin-dependent oxidoreductase (nitroreductase family)
MPQTKYIKYVPREATMKRIGKLHVRLYRATWGLLGRRVDGLNILLLTTTGKKTGIARTVPLPYFRDGTRYVLVASFGGNDKHPAWFHNLKATPEVELQVGRKRMKMRAVITEAAERERIWGQITRNYPRYLVYQAKTERTIPVVVLEPSR